MTVHVSLANYEVQMSRGNSQAFFMDYTVAISLLLVPIPTRYYIIVASPVPRPPSLVPLALVLHMSSPLSLAHRADEFR